MNNSQVFQIFSQMKILPFLFLHLLRFVNCALPKFSLLLKNMQRSQQNLWKKNPLLIMKSAINISVDIYCFGADIKKSKEKLLYFLKISEFQLFHYVFIILCNMFHIYHYVPKTYFVWLAF